MSELGSATATFAYPLSASDIEFLSSVMPIFSWLDSLLAMKRKVEEKEVVKGGEGKPTYLTLVS